MGAMYNGLRKQSLADTGLGRLRGEHVELVIGVQVSGLIVFMVEFLAAEMEDCSGMSGIGVVTVAAAGSAVLIGSVASRIFGSVGEAAFEGTFVLVVEIVLFETAETDFSRANDATGLVIELTMDLRAPPTLMSFDLAGALMDLRAATLLSFAFATMLDNLGRTVAFDELEKEENILLNGKKDGLCLPHNFQ